MNGAHDLGGQHGFGPVQPEPAEPVFHAPWEGRMLALNVAMGATGTWSIDASRHARESLPPAVYLTSSYYRIWRLGLERLVIDHGLASAEELATGVAVDPPRPVARTLAADRVDAVLAAGFPYDRPAPAPAQFQVGQAVLTRVMHPVTHTRLPRYARGKPGVVERVHGYHVFPDSHAHGGGEAPQWLYSVRFAAPELWGQDADPTVSVRIDLWESYLVAAPQ
ncbi:MAG: nitrile hydratase subunit beta [Alphaproteobacteria bacterium]|nr:nitrile hydratase subunit beta [Alphaproteobacteria bacterium]